ncbi:MAG TPA: hypothetical protein VFJ71_07210 [Candidatus Limnocylindrales bacterium]|nr:hypothetical protein [Candidatus Limnocylindrales bacterium]
MTTALLVAAGLTAPAIVVLLVLFLLGSFVASLAEAAPTDLVRPSPS